MPRQDVPYGGAICRLKERIAEIWDELGKKLHSINGVEGDGAGDVKIVSGNAAVVVTSDQVNHEIEIALDSSQLPAASVSSVNGQTGAVVLDANDIDAGLVPPGISVAQDLAGTKQQMQVIGGLVQQEVIDRQNADSALQGNINAALASIPGEVSSQITNDATIAQLVTADGQNVKLTGNQSISGVKTVPTEATGTYSQQIANSTKVRNDIFNWALTKTASDTFTGQKTSTVTRGFNARVGNYAVGYNCTSPNDEYNVDAPQEYAYPYLNYDDKNGQQAAILRFTHNGKVKTLQFLIKGSDGNFHATNLAQWTDP